ncbi:hypothetical protein AB0C84_13830 [Actinomadura sp. NPDC048955]|uniref:hypothetical protein n=1 Tax=Actinomadura sp. NPDC048955 TaxID=3158228 RepID=UPI0033C31FC8
MNVFLGVRIPVRKILRGAAVAAAGLAAVVAAGCSTHSDSETPNNERPPAATAPVEPATPVASTTATAEPSAEPSTSQPEATASDSAARPGKVVAAFEDEPGGPFLVLTSMDEDQGDLEYAASQKYALRALDVTALPISTAWKVNVSSDVLQACAPNLTRMVFKDYPSCAGSADAAPSTTTDR